MRKGYCNIDIGASAYAEGTMLLLHQSYHTYGRRIANLAMRLPHCMEHRLTLVRENSDFREGHFALVGNNSDVREGRFTLVGNNSDIREGRFTLVRKNSDVREGRFTLFRNNSDIRIGGEAMNLYAQ